MFFVHLKQIELEKMRRTEAPVESEPRLVVFGVF